MNYEAKRDAICDLLQVQMPISEIVEVLKVSKTIVFNIKLSLNVSRMC